MQTPWIGDKVVYQIYPKSFRDTTGNGCGDLRGIIEGLDYLHFLGVDILWLTPIYPSPQVDNGYDVSNYCAIDPAFGSMQDFEELVMQAGQRNMLIMMDMVFNHTSTQHPWFIQACDPHSPYHHWYLWQGTAADRPPTRWLSKFGGSAWQWQPECGQHYLHLFSREQADLNWDHPPVREALKQVCRFWADKGVRALRLDVINLISKPSHFEEDPEGDGRQYYTDGPRVHEYLQELSREVFRPLGLMTVGEMSSTTLSHCLRYASVDAQELTMVFNFHHLKVDYRDGNKWVLAAPDFVVLKRLFAEWQQGLYQRANGTLFWGNHDQPRVVSRFGDDQRYRTESAKMLALLLYGMQGTAYLYQGEEIGMTNAGFTDLAQYRDIESLNIYRELLSHGSSHQQAMTLLCARSRDNSRTPMQWDHTLNAGFSRGTPWIDLPADRQEISVAAALADHHSVLYTYRQLIRLRKTLPILHFGDYEDLCPQRADLWCYRRQWQGQQLLVVANLSAEPVDWSPPRSSRAGDWQLIISNQETTPPKPLKGTLSAYQAAWWLFTP